jgi:hypothetical protein
MESVKTNLVDEQGTPVNLNAKSARVVVPNDNTEVNFKSLYVGTQGDLVVILQNDNVPITYVGVQGFCPISPRRILAATTAQDIIGHP